MARRSYADRPSHGLWMSDRDAIPQSPLSSRVRDVLVILDLSGIRKFALERLRTDVIEVSLKGPAYGNPLLDVTSMFTLGTRFKAKGLADPNGVYTILLSACRKISITWNLYIDEDEVQIVIEDLQGVRKALQPTDAIFRVLATYRPHWNQRQDPDDGGHDIPFDDFSQPYILRVSCEGKPLQ